MKLIDRDELLRNIEADIDISVTGVRNMESVKCCLQNILDDVKESPVVDAVEVIRCKDCKHSEPWYADKCRCFMWSESGIDVYEDGYCNYAERKEHETD